MSPAVAASPATSAAVSSVAVSPESPSFPFRLTLVCFLVVAGAFCVVLTALPYKAFELDRHFIPKELVLHLTAGITAVLCLVRVQHIVLTRIDILLLAYLALSIASAIFAPNWWLAQRSLAITSSGIALFWVARTLNAAGYTRALLLGVVLAAIAGIVTALAQAYGVVGEYASLSRAPGGTFGNRNFMAHLGAICIPTLILLIAQARKAGIWIGTIGLVLVSAGLVLSRTRAAWLALAVCAFLCMPLLVWLLFLSKRKRLQGHAPQGLRNASVAGNIPEESNALNELGRRKLRMIVFAIVIGSMAALLLPNTLNWKSDSPYLDSMKDVVNYKEGSGDGRVKQYTNSLKLVVQHPLFGVGPGNWPVEYPTVAPKNDKSINQDNGMTSNPWPSSDWVAMISERGIAATIVFLLAWFGLAIGAWRQWIMTSIDGKSTSLTSIATLIIASLTGVFDAVLLIAIPSFFVWTILGALTPPMPMRRVIALDRRRRVGLIAAVFLAGTLVSLRSAAQIHAMSLYDPSNSQALREAARFDPGSYRIQLRLAELQARRGNCTAVKQSTGRAHDLFQHAREPKRLLRRCER